VIHIFDSRGELVRTLCGELPNPAANPVLGAATFHPNPSGEGGSLTILLNGQSLAVWDVTDQKGNLVPNGYYFLTLTQPLQDGSTVDLKWTVYIGASSSVPGVEFSARPNLIQGGGPARFSVVFPGGPADSRSVIRIYTVGGERVRLLDLSAGTVSWDLRNENQEMVSSGLYLAVLDGVEVGTGVRVKKTIRLVILK
jgi:hypothetical protein